MRHVFHPEAALEFEESARYYKARGQNLGPRFRSQIRASIATILETPERWRKLESDVRRYLVKVFPYTILYTIEPEFILIIAIAHYKREPGYWRHRMQGKPGTT